MRPRGEKREIGIFDAVEATAVVKIKFTLSLSFILFYSDQNKLLMTRFTFSISVFFILLIFQQKHDT
jgi:hypothetical protein